MCLSTEMKLAILEPALSFDKTYVLEFQISKLNTSPSNIMGFGYKNIIDYLLYIIKILLFFY